MILAGLLPAASKLRSVNLEDSGLCSGGMSGFHLLAESLPKTKIRRLNLSSNGLGDAGAHTLAAVLRKCAITHLYLAGNELCGVNMLGAGTHVSGGLQALCKEVAQTQIELIDLSFNSIRETGGAHVTAMLDVEDETPYLSVLDVQSNELPQVTLENLMIASQAAQWSNLKLTLEEEGESEDEL